jgi:hypothetical protein
MNKLPSETTDFSQLVQEKESSSLIKDLRHPGVGNSAPLFSLFDPYYFRIYRISSLKE